MKSYPWETRRLGLIKETLNPPFPEFLRAKELGEHQYTGLRKDTIPDGNGGGPLPHPA